MRSVRGLFVPFPRSWPFLMSAVSPSGGLGTPAGQMTWPSHLACSHMVRPGETSGIIHASWCCTPCTTPC